VINEARPGEGMSLIVKTVSHWLKVLLLLFGIQITLYGHLTPGGGFPGGVIVACAFILITLAESSRVSLNTLSKTVASELDSAGALIFLVIGIIGLLLTDSAFLMNFLPPGTPFNLASGGVMPIINIGIGLKVGTCLFMVFTILAALRVVRSNGNHEIVRRSD